MGTDKMQTWTSAPQKISGTRLALITALVLGLTIAVVFFLVKNTPPAQPAAAAPMQNAAKIADEKTSSLPSPQAANPTTVIAAVNTPAALVPKTWAEDFSSGSLDAANWVATSKNDFKEKTIDVVKSGASNHLRLRASTMDTDDKTVKYLGVRSVEKFALQPGMKISVDLDWNSQENGCYLSAGIVLCPSSTTANPLDEPEWLKVEYFGVPPGKNGRVVIGQRSGGREQQLYTEGWPEVRREGRAIGRQHVEIAYEKSELIFSENGTPIYTLKDTSAVSQKAHIYLQMSSHSNYPAREVFFEHLTVETVGANGK